VHLPYKEELHEYGSRIKHVYFLTSAVVSMLYVMADGEMTEVAVVGHEGVVGISHIMGEGALCSSVVHTEGYGYKLKADILKNAFSKGGELQRLLLRYMQALFSQISINTVSSRHYTIEQQVCLWLLDRLDRLPSNEIKVTHELIANMLGIRRESVTEATRRLHNEGLIDTSRGSIKVTNRRGLEMLSSECYYTAKKQYDLVCAN
jgi:CRP-like cAMP-binding protein